MNGERIEKAILSWSKSNEWMVLKNESIILFLMFCFCKNRTFILLFLNIVLDLLGKVAGPFFVLSLQLRSHSSWIDPIFITINWLCVTEPFLGSCHGHFLRSNLFSSSSSSNSSSRESWTTFHLDLDHNYWCLARIIIWGKFSILKTWENIHHAFASLVSGVTT